MPTQKQLKTTQKVGGKAPTTPAKAPAKTTQKVGGNPKKPVMKATQGGTVATPMKTKTVKEGGMGLYDETKKRSLRNEYLIKVLLKDLYQGITKKTKNIQTFITLDEDTDLSQLDNVMNGNVKFQDKEVIFNDS